MSFSRCIGLVRQLIDFIIINDTFKIKVSNKRFILIFYSLPLGIHKQDMSTHGHQYIGVFKARYITTEWALMSSVLF